MMTTMIARLASLLTILGLCAGLAAPAAAQPVLLKDVTLSVTGTREAPPPSSH